MSDALYVVVVRWPDGSTYVVGRRHSIASVRALVAEYLSRGATVEVTEYGQPSNVRQGWQLYVPPRDTGGVDN